jgi:hypothetical protein
VVVAAVPVVAGWLFQVTPFSVQVALFCSAWRVWPVAAEAA